MKERKKERKKGERDWGRLGEREEEGEEEVDVGEPKRVKWDSSVYMKVVDTLFATLPEPRILLKK